MTNKLITEPNPDLVVIEGNKSHWTHADFRRHGMHNLPRIARYGMSFRSGAVLKLEQRADLRIANLETVRHYTSLPWFSAMVVIRGQSVLFEKYAADFGARCLHSIQSITKTMMNLVIGSLLDKHLIDLSKPIRHYLPNIGSGYANATVQQVLNMDVVNEYSEDFSDPASTYYDHEEAMGWRLPKDSEHEETQRSFLTRIKSADTTNHSRHVQYKDANTDVLGWIVERVSGRTLRSFVADIVDAAGIEDSLYISTDREGFPTLDGGACLTARDLARYFSIFARRGRGVDGKMIGSEAFIEQTMKSGVPKPSPLERVRYSNQLVVYGRALAHSGWAGQCAMANLDTATVGVFFSVLETAHADDLSYLDAVASMLESVTSLNGEL